jgi:hypothetical protein
MTTESHARQRWPLAVYCALALAIWFGGLTIAARLFEPTTAVLVIGPGRDAVIASAVAANVDLLDTSLSSLVVSGRSRGFVKQLYASGAWLVLPVGSGGCRSSVIRRATLA